MPAIRCEGMESHPAIRYEDIDMAKAKKLKPGDAARDGQVMDVDGQEAELSSYWADGPVLLTFLRHFG